MAKKRSNGEGTIRQRDSGRWECTIMIGYQDDGRRKRKTFYGKTKTEVQKKIREYQVAKENGELPSAEYSFPAWADIWYENHKDNVKPTTQENYRYTLRILKDHFERRQLADIKAMDIEQFLKKLRRDGRSDSCLTQCRGMLYQIFNKAEANDLVKKNPVRFAEKMRKRPPNRKEAFTAEEVKLLLENLPEDQVGWGIRLMLCTGMRTQELLGLEPRHIAEDGSTITIEQAVVMEKGTAVGTGTFVALIAGVFDGEENVGDDERILIFNDGRFPFHDHRGQAGGGVKSNILQLVLPGTVEDVIAVFKSKIIDRTFVGEGGIGNCVFFVSNFKHDRPPMGKVGSRMLCRRLPSCTVVPPPTKIS